MTFIIIFGITMFIGNIVSITFGAADIGKYGPKIGEYLYPNTIEEDKKIRKKFR